MDGILLINKPKGITSRDVVNKVSHILKTKKVGHTGTLDPMATGVLVLCIGKATKLVDLITVYDKEYTAEISLGIETDTLDMEGNIIKKEIVKDITNDEITDILNTFIGSSTQEVPSYSAIKVNGKKLYQYARENIDVELPKRDINIYELKLISDVDYKNEYPTFKISCKVSKGTYIRSLVRDIGLKLNSIATMSSLIRTKQGKYNIEECNGLDDIENNNYKLISINEVLSNIPSIKVDLEMEFKIKNGAIIDKFFDGDKAVIIDQNNTVIAIYQVYDKDDTKAKPYKMLI
jgi:tRNA pseudouridine55 synthase